MSLEDRYYWREDWEKTHFFLQKFHYCNIESCHMCLFVCLYIKPAYRSTYCMADFLQIHVISQNCLFVNKLIVVIYQKC